MVHERLSASCGATSGVPCFFFTGCFISECHTDGWRFGKGWDDFSIMAVQAQSGGGKSAQAKLEISIEREMSMTGFDAELTQGRAPLSEKLQVNICGR
jgi:hypothetical protein